MASWARGLLLAGFLAAIAAACPSARPAVAGAEPAPELVISARAGVPRAGRAVSTLPAPDDPAFGETVGDVGVQWPLHQLEALAAWGLYPGEYYDAESRPADAPLVALIGTGVDAEHPDFVNVGGASAAVAQGGQLALSAARTLLTGHPDDGSSCVRDEHGGGTHLGAIIAAAANNGATAGSGIAGLGYALRLLPIKVAGAYGGASHADVARAIVYAADQGADVILIGPLSLTWSEVLQEAVDYAWERHRLVIAPAGDGGLPAFPGACPHVFAVGALTANGELAGYSTSGDHVDLMGPGGDAALGVYSCLPTYACTLRSNLTEPAYGWLYGTAQAAAHAAAAAGLYMGRLGSAGAQGSAASRAWCGLQRAAVQLGGEHSPGWDACCGYGALSVTGLLSEAGPVDQACGGMTGRVLVEGVPAFDARVEAVDSNGEVAAEATSCWPAGAYRLSGLPPGRYRVTASVGGHSGVWSDVLVESGCAAPGVDFRLNDPEADAGVRSAEIPTSALRGDMIAVSLTVENTGESVWRRGDGYCLRQLECGSAFDGTAPVVLLNPGEVVAPGEARTFSMSVRAPDDYGLGEIGWRMCQDGGQGFFGDAARGAISVTTFLDVPADHWAVDEVEAAAEAGIVHGYEDGRYGPDLSITRDQMAVYLARALLGGDDGVPPGPDGPTFTDVPLDHWAYAHVEYVASHDIAHGYEDGCYRPNEELDRAQMAVFIARAMAGGEAAVAGYEPDGAPSFEDVPEDAWMYRHVEYVAEEDVVSGYPDALYHPEWVCTRDQMAVYVVRAFGL